MTRNTIAIAASRASPRSPNASAWSPLTPPSEYEAPAGSFNAFSRVVSAAVVAPMLLPVASAPTVAQRWPSMRLIEAGPSTSATMATRLSGTIPAGVGSGSALT